MADMPGFIRLVIAIDLRCLAAHRTLDGALKALGAGQLHGGVWEIAVAEQDFDLVALYEHLAAHLHFDGPPKDRDRLAILTVTGGKSSWEHGPAQLLPPA